MAETSEPGLPEQPEQHPKIDPIWRALFERMATDTQFGQQVSLRIHRDLEVHLEHMLADLVRDYLIGNTALKEEQRDQIHMEIVPTMFQTHYIVNYVLPGSPEDQQHTVICFWKEEEERWKVLPLSGLSLV